MMVFVLLAAFPAVPGSAASPQSGFSYSATPFLYKLVFNTAQKLADAVVFAVNAVFPSPLFTGKSDYVSENFYEGTGVFRDKTGENARWRLGYANASLLTGNELDGNHFVGGQISTKRRKVATEIWDDMKIRVAAISDGTGGTVVFAGLDLYGLANSDVREIRSRLADYAQKNGVVSINLAALHQHSVIDTLGMNGDLKDAFIRNPLINLLNLDMPLKNGKNPAFMENLYRVAAETIVKACENMEPGALYYGAAGAEDYVVDGRRPFVNDTDLNRLRFDPDNPRSKETWFVTWCAHCLGNGADNTQVTSDCDSAFGAKVLSVKTPLSAKWFFMFNNACLWSPGVKRCMNPLRAITASENRLSIEKSTILPVKAAALRFSAFSFFLVSITIGSDRSIAVTS